MKVRLDNSYRLLSAFLRLDSMISASWMFSSSLSTNATFLKEFRGLTIS
jgi:hypothetical protein